MRFLDINGCEKLWSVVYDGEEQVRSFLIEQGAVDVDGLKELT